jgi:cysteinyl-tRNA synthetase
MSKSLGNLVFPRDLLRDHEPAAVRLALLAHHWRSPWEWDPAELKEAAERLSNWRQACGQPRAPSPGVGYPPVRGPQQSGVGAAARVQRPQEPGVGAAARVQRPQEPGVGAGARLPEAVEAALAADLDTPAALAAGDELAERGDGPGVAATAAVLGVDLGPANG